MKKTYILPFLLLLSVIGHSQIYHVNEDFNLGVLPLGWTNTAVSGTQTWSFGINGASAHSGNTNINGTSFAYFDDDLLGASATNNTVELTTPAFDNSRDSSTTLEFEYNFREFAGVSDSFAVDVYDGIQWINVLRETSNNCGNYIVGCSNGFPKATIDISAFKNANCQVKFRYHDGNDWSWYVGLDNVQIYSPTGNDVGVSKFVGSTTTCGLTTAEIVTVQINNYGTDTVNTPFGITLNVNNGQQLINETISVGIPPNDSLIYSFTNSVNLAAIGTYSILSYTTYALDLVNSNDSLALAINNNSIEQLPYYEDFKTMHSWRFGGLNTSWQTGIPNGNTIKTRYSNNNSIATNLSGTYNSNENSFAESPCFDLSSSNIPIISFDANYNLESNFDSLFFESSIDGGLTWQTIPADSTSSNWPNSSSFWTGSSNGWMQVENRLPQLSNQFAVQFRFRLKSDASSNLDGVAIDNFAVRYNSIHDIQLTQILSPGSISICSSGNSNIMVELKNKGLTPLDSFIISYQVNSGPIFMDTLQQLILPEQKIDYNFSSRFNFLNGMSNVLSVWVNNKNDIYTKNDSILNYIIDTSNFKSVYATPYIQNFDDTIWKNVPRSTLTLGKDWTRNFFNSQDSWLVRVADRSNCRVTNAFRTLPARDASGNISQFLTTYTNGIGNESILTSPCIELP